MKMKMMIAICCLLVMVSAVASACGPRVLIHDSDTRLLNQKELERYSYDALGYILNEIVARHGYHFDKEGKYYWHFSDCYEYNEWTDSYECFYEEAPSYISNQQIYESLSRTEQKNMSLIKKVRENKRKRGEYTGEDLGLWMCSE